MKGNGKNARVEIDCTVCIVLAILRRYICRYVLAGIYIRAYGRDGTDKDNGTAVSGVCHRFRFADRHFICFDIQKKKKR